MTTISPDPLERSTAFDRLFDRRKFRRRTLKVYRIAGPLALVVCLYYALAAAGVWPEMPAGSLPGWFYSAAMIVTMGLAAVIPVLFVLSTVGGLSTAADWRFAAPLWCFSAASGLFLVTAFLGAGMSRDDRAQVWLVASLLFCISAAWATAVGYRRRPAGTS